MAIAAQTLPVNRSISGVGIGLRAVHMREILTEPPTVPWLELLADNHLAAGGLDCAMLDEVAGQYPLTLHCVGMSLGGSDPLDTGYLGKIAALAQRVNAHWVSDHLCFTSAQGRYTHDLIPLPYTQQCLQHYADRISQVQDFFGQQILVENVSAYLHYTASVIDERDFFFEVAERADCALLVDVNNIYVNQVNHGIDGEKFIDELPLARVGEVHLAGFQEKEDFLLDAHNNPVAPAVWQLYQRLMQRAPNVPTLIEWDNDIPPLATLLAEVDKARAVLDS